MQLNIEQRKLVVGKPAGHSLIKGVAGSGKTTVAVNRIPFLLSNYSYENDDVILMVTYNKTLNKFIEYLYEKVEEENKVEHLSFFSKDNKNLHIITIDSLIYRYFKEYLKENKKNYELLIDNNKKYSVINQSMMITKKYYEDVKILDQRYNKFLLDEIEWIKACNYREIEEYQNCDRLGRMGKNNDGPQKLLKNSKVREAIFRVMEQYDNLLRKDNLVDFMDMTHMALEQVNKRPIVKYTHIIVDESQDLSKLQLEFIKSLYNHKKYSSILFVADTAQSIYSNAWLVKGRSFASIGFDMTGKSNALAKNYRTTTQIAQAAYSLIECDMNITDDDNFVKPSLIDKQGQYPVYTHFSNSNEELNYIVNEINSKLIKGYDYRDIAIIARTKTILDNVKQYFDKAKVPCKVFNTKEQIDFKSNEIKILTMHSIKGLEFKVVFIVNLNKKVIPISNYGMEEMEIHESKERKLLYVGMTRATEKLYLTSYDEPSTFVDDINADFLNISSNNRFKKFRNVLLDQYIFENKIANKYAYEEKVRQWMLRQLIDSYNYPKELLDVEYKVNAFSKEGFIDICVNIYKNNTIRTPFIFIECKRKGKGIDEGMNQLKSYMSCEKECQYGIVTDGNMVKIVNSDLEEIEDIPIFNSNMLPTRLECYEYIDLKHDKRYDFARECSYVKNILVNDGEKDYDIEENDLRALNIYNDIAAGKPIFMDDSIEGDFYLPQDWFNKSEQVFMVKVKGDSMIGANINNGDYVVISYCQSVANREIVAVDIDGNATLKRFMKMGDSVLLISENDAYEPIQVHASQVKVIGKAVGVVKYKS